jgi:hypothetical protein
VTQTGAILGTPLYMAPGQVDAKSVEVRTDKAAAAFRELQEAHPGVGLCSYPDGGIRRHSRTD